MIQHTQNKLVAIVGPTASGKTSLSLSLASQYNGEIISVDSRQLYREFNIGTDKITGDKEIHYGFPVINHSGILHYMIDVLEPTQEFSLGAYTQTVQNIIKTLFIQEKNPFLVGGTMLYTQAIIDNYVIPPVAPNENIRARIQQEIDTQGLEYVVSLLRERDPDCMDFMDTRNPRRVIRALEVIEVTGKPFSYFRKKDNPLYEVLQIAPLFDRTALKEKICRRVDEHVAQGLLEEAALLRDKYGVNIPAFDSIGYKQLIPYLQNEQTKEDAVSAIKKATWHYAKRQMTWYRKDPRIQWVSSLDDAKKLLDTFFAS